jgi:hypothetical protein
MGLGFSVGKSDLREKASDAETIRKAWKNWDKMFEEDGNLARSENNTINPSPPQNRNRNDSSNSRQTPSSSQKVRNNPSLTIVVDRNLNDDNV